VRPSTRKARTEVRQLATAVARRSRIKGTKVEAHLNPQLMAQIDRMVETGRYGDTREDVIVYLIIEAVDRRQQRAAGRA